MSIKRDNFVRLAEPRVNKALKAIQVIGNLANKSNYDYTEEDIKAIVAALNQALSEMKSRFKNDGVGTEKEFRLKR